MIRKLSILFAIIVLTVAVVLMSAFRVDERKQALVLQFGQVKQEINEPGLYFKIPFIQEVAFYESRILPLETSELEVTPADERRLVVDAFARWRIIDVVKFRQAAQTEFAALPRLERILNTSVREVLGGVNSSDVLSPERGALMESIRNLARTSAENLGVEIIDVRIRRADLPEQNLNATFERMNAERQREAADERARGRERAQEIRATADRQSVELVSDARRESEVTRGEADAERNAIYADAFGRDEEFFAFYRSLRAYEVAIKGQNSTLVISPDSDFFEYLKSPGVAAIMPVPPSTDEAPAALEEPAATEDEVEDAPAGGEDGASGAEDPDTGDRAEAPAEGDTAAAAAEGTVSDDAAATADDAAATADEAEATADEAAAAGEDAAATVDEAAAAGDEAAATADEASATADEAAATADEAAATVDEAAATSVEAVGAVDEGPGAVEEGASAAADGAAALGDEAVSAVSDGAAALTDEAAAALAEGEASAVEAVQTAIPAE